MRIDIGMHDGGVTDKVMAEKWKKGQMTRFLNEVESGPTLYIDARFKHPVDWISFMSQKCVETAYEVTGIPKPELVEEMKKRVDAGILAGVEKAKKLTKKIGASKTASKTASKKAATSKKAAAVKSTKKTMTKKIAKGATKTTKTTTTKKAKA